MEYAVTVTIDNLGERVLAIAGVEKHQAELTLQYCEEGSHGYEWCRIMFPTEVFQIRIAPRKECWWNIPVEEW